MANNVMTCTKVIEDCVKAGIKINSFNYTVDEALEIWASESIPDALIEMLNKDVQFMDMGIDFVRRNKFCIWVTF